MRRDPRRGGRAVAVKADVTKIDDIRRLAEEATAAFGRIHILVNNAGGLLRGRR